MHAFSVLSCRYDAYSSILFQMERKISSSHRGFTRERFALDVKRVFAQAANFLFFSYSLCSWSPKLLHEKLQSMVVDPKTRADVANSQI